MQFLTYILNILFPIIFTLIKRTFQMLYVLFLALAMGFQNIQTTSDSLKSRASTLYLISLIEISVLRNSALPYRARHNYGNTHFIMVLDKKKV